MQTIERCTARLKPEGDSREIVAVSNEPEAGNRGRLAAAGLPLLLLVSACLFSYAQRQVPLGKSTNASTAVSAASVLAAKGIVADLSRELTGEVPDPSVMEVSQEEVNSGYHKTYREWNVTCVLPGAGKYLMRINPTTHSIYAVNRLVEEDPASLAIARPARGHGAEHSGEVLQADAMRYLRGCGFPQRMAVGADTARISRVQFEDHGLTRDYTMYYRIPGHAERALNVSIYRASGQLRQLWIPAGAR